MDQSQHGTRIVYPTLPATFAEGDIATLFKVSVDEKIWASTVARRGPSMVALLAQLKVFEHIGRFLPLRALPNVSMSYVAQQLSLEMPLEFVIDRRTTYRHNSAIRHFLRITPWGAKARGVASAAIASAAEARIDPADLINAAIDSLIRERCELPLLSSLRRLAGTAHRLVNVGQWRQVHELLSAKDMQGLDELLTPTADTQESAFAVMCRGAGKPTR